MTVLTPTHSTYKHQCLIPQTDAHPSTFEPSRHILICTIQQTPNQTYTRAQTQEKYHTHAYTHSAHTSYIASSSSSTPIICPARNFNKHHILAINTLRDTKHLAPNIQSVRRYISTICQISPKLFEGQIRWPVPNPLIEN